MKRIFYLFLLLTFFNCNTSKNVIVNKENVTTTYKSEPNKNNILYIVDGKTVNAAYLKKISPKKIESVTVIKDKKEVAKYCF